MQLLEKHLILEQPGGKRRELVAAKPDLLELGVGCDEGHAKVDHATVLKLELT